MYFGRRNSIRLEPDLWEALREIDLRKKRTMHDICPNIDKTRGGPRLTSAILIYMVSYCRSAANPYRAVFILLRRYRSLDIQSVSFRRPTTTHGMYSPAGVTLSEAFCFLPRSPARSLEKPDRVKGDCRDRFQHIDEMSASARAAEGFRTLRFHPGPIFNPERVSESLAGSRDTSRTVPSLVWTSICCTMNSRSTVSRIHISCNGSPGFISPRNSLENG